MEKYLEDIAKKLQHLNVEIKFKDLCELIFQINSNDVFISLNEKEMLLVCVENTTGNFLLEINLSNMTIFDSWLSDDYDKQIHHNILACLCFYDQTDLIKKLVIKFRTKCFPENETK